MSQSESTRYSDGEVIKELKRELAMRVRVYGQQVRALEMTQDEMNHRIGIVQQLIGDLTKPPLFTRAEPVTAPITPEEAYAKLDGDSLDAIVEVIGAPAQYNAGKSAMRQWFLNRLRGLWGIQTPPASLFDGVAKEATPSSAEDEAAKAVILHRIVTVHLDQAPAERHSPVTELWDQGWRWKQATTHISGKKITLRSVVRPPGEVPAWVEVSREGQTKGNDDE